MAEPILFPDATLAVVNGLRAALLARGDTATVGTIVPANGRSVTVNRNGGGTRRDVVIEDAVLTISCRDDQAEDAVALAQLARALLGHLAGTAQIVRVGDAQLDDAQDPLTDQPLTKFAIQIAMRGTAA